MKLRALAVLLACAVLAGYFGLRVANADIVCVPRSSCGFSGTAGGSVTIPSGSQLILPAGSATVPSLRMTDADTGLYEFTSGQITVTTNGTGRFTVADADVVMTTRLGFGALLSGPDVGIKRAAAGVLQLTNGSTGQGVMHGGSGTVAAPTYGFTADSASGTGFFLANNGVIGTTSQGVAGLELGAGWVRATSGEAALNADYTNATTTYSNTALSVPLVAGRTYSFTVGLLLTDSTAADGVKIDFNGGAATVTNFRVGCAMDSDTGTAVTFAAATSTTLAGVINAAAMATTNQHALRCTGTFVPSGGGTFILRAAQNAHTAGTLTIHRGSWISVRDARAL